MTSEREPLWIPTPDEIAALRRTLEQQDKRIAELEQKLSRAAQYKGAEAYPCPLCRYEDGIFVESCAMHNRIAELETQLSQTWQPLPINQVVQYNGEWPAMPAEYANDQLAICRLVERAEPQSNGWKSANESLPEGHAWVLVYADGAIDCMGYSPDKGFEDWTEQQAPNVNISEITHWKELQRPTEVDHE